MTKLFTVATQLFTVMLSAPSYAEWMKVGEKVSGDNFYAMVSSYKN